ncbi:MAG TPA: exopolysaccharide transport family protein [Rhodoblastus sp.]|nr:exopolysaccharide transport family protein [Rhodoblastus sp.]
MNVSQIMATERPGAAAATPERTDHGLADSGNPWRDAATLLGRRARAQLRALIVASLVCAALAGMAKLVLPTTYKASAQILIDPQEFRPYDADAPASTLEANAAINYVESQMGVIGSERVLLRVIHELGLAGAPPTPPDAESAPQARRARELVENKALLTLQKAISVTRAERSFLVTITAASKSPDRAAELANAVVKAYGDVNAMDRMASARRLADDLNMRVEDLRRQLGASETKLLNFKVAHNLLGMNDKTIAERRIAETTDALAAAENRETQARARLKQLESSRADVGAVPSFGPDPESRQLQLFIEGRAAARNELEQLQGTLGDRHPAVVAGMARLREFDRRVAKALEGLRRSTRAQLAEAEAQAEALSKKLTDLSAETTRAREFEPQILEMEADVEARRKSLTTLQTRWRDADDMSRREAPNFRIISPARAPNAKSLVVSAIFWTIAGGVIGAALGFGGLALSVMFEAPGAARECVAEVENAAAKIPTRPPPKTLAWLADLPPLAPAGAEELLREAQRRPDSPFSEIVRTIYHQLRDEAEARRGAEDQRPLVVLVAATAPHAGASTLAANLARVAAAADERALLIDAHAARPAQDKALPENAPKTLIRLAGLERPLVRLAPFTQSLSLIPSWDDEEQICAEIAAESRYRPIAGITGHFDFVVLDGPDAKDENGLHALVAAADQFVLVVGRTENAEAEAAELLTRLSVRPGVFTALVGAAPRDEDDAAAA